MHRRDLIKLSGAALSGTAIGWPLAVHAQNKGVPVVGWLHFASPAPFAYQVVAFRQGLAESGFVDGQNVAIEYRWAEGRNDRLPALAADLVGDRVQVLVAIGPPAAAAAKNATATIPIVFAAGVDPIAAGFVATLARPGGNLTGISILVGDLMPKRLELLSELVPQARHFALLVNPDEATPWIADLEQAAHGKGLQLAVLKATNDSEIKAAFASLRNLQADALVIGDAVFFTSRREQIAALASRYAVPMIDRWRESAAAGCLISYGPSLADTVRHLGIYVARILKGEKPADLPVQQPTTFELVINLKTAKTLGLTVPQSLLARADDVIE